MTLYWSQNLEIHVVDHCNLDCVGCSHEAPFMSPRVEDPVNLSIDLTRLWRCYRAPLVKLLGGEPLLHPALDEVIVAVQDSTDARVRVVTNGTLLRDRYHMLRNADEIHISTYPEVPLLSDDFLVRIAIDLGATIVVQAFDSFRRHRSEGSRSWELTKRVFHTCQMYHKWRCYSLRAGWFYPCPSAAIWSQHKDGAHLLNHSKDICRDLGQLLSRKSPFASCSRCMGSVGQRFAHLRGWKISRSIPVGDDVDSEYMKELEQSPCAFNSCFEYLRTIHPSGEIEVHVQPETR